jgi:hypothetical protein
VDTPGDLNAPARPRSLETFAKAGVLGIMSAKGVGEGIEKFEKANVLFFAREVEEYLRAQDASMPPIFPLNFNFSGTERAIDR